MRILVTGASGFVGRHFVALAQAAGHEIVATVQEDSAPPELDALSVCVTGFDVREESVCARVVQDAAPTALVHLAGVSSVGYSWRHPFETFDVNVIGTMNMLRAVQAYGECRIALTVGSAEAYGSDGTAEHPLLEEDPLRPLNPYGGSKAAQEMLAMGLRNLLDCRMVAARSFPHSGPGQQRPFVLPDWTAQLLEIRSTPRPLRVGNVDVVRDILDVRDVAAAYLALLETPTAEGVFNVCSGRGHRLLDVLKELSKIVGVSLEVQIDETRVRPDEIQSLVGSSRRLRDTTGWSPSHELRTTLEDLVASVEAELTVS